MPTEMRGSASLAPAFREATELANDAVDLADFAQSSLALLARVLGYDVAAMQVGVGRDRFAPLAVTGVDGTYLARLKARWPVYASELTPLARSARTHGIAIDTNLDPVSRECSRYFQEIVAPQGGGSTLFCDLGLRGAKLGMFMIGRRSGFAADEVKLLSALRPLLALGVRSYVTDEFARATRRDRSNKVRRRCCGAAGSTRTDRPAASSRMGGPCAIEPTWPLREGSTPATCLLLGAGHSFDGSCGVAGVSLRAGRLGRSQHRRNPDIRRLRRQRVAWTS